MRKFEKKLPYIIAEIASAHDGKVNLAIEIAKKAIASKADAVKFQIFDSKNLLTKKNPFLKEFKEIEFSFKNWKKIIRAVKNKKISLIVEPYDVASLDFAKKLNVFSGYKVPASCLYDQLMLNKLKKIKKPIILSVGAAEFSEIKYAYSQLAKFNSNIILMCGFQNFPTKIQDAELNKITKLKKYFKTAIGYADHTDAEKKNLAFGIPLMACGLGATVIEKHITKNRKIKGNDYFSSLNPDEFYEFVDFLKSCPKALGKSKKWILSKAEIKYKKFTSKFAVAKKYIRRGEKITKDNIIFKRTNKIGILQNSIGRYIGKKIKKNKLPDEMIYSKEIR
tara:strand:+ start:1686 stop:2693 length:1008 start_codon:yes stop_codon:yes gene_type:complete